MKNEELSLINQSLLLILEEHIPFRVVLKNQLDNHKVDGEFRKKAVSLIARELHHHLALMFALKTRFTDADIKALSPLLILLTIHLAVPEQEATSFIAWAIEECQKAGLTVTNEQLEELINSYPDVKSLNQNDDHLTHKSLLFNTPKSIIKMWTKHYTRDVSDAILRANLRRQSQIVRVNTKKVDADKLLEESEVFASTPYNDHLVYLPKNVNLVTNNHYQSGQIIPSSLGSKHILDNVTFNELDKVVVIQNYPGTFYLDVLGELSPLQHVDVIFNSHQDLNLFVAKKKIWNPLSDAHFYYAQANQLVSVITQPVEKVFLVCNSSNFANIRLEPDFFVHFETNLLDQYIAHEKASLKEADLVTAVGGELVYIVPTINKKESNLLIEEFLKEHPNYSLVKEEQLFPFDELDATYYYAILKKESVSHD